jgi:hypothetical protein
MQFKFFIVQGHEPHFTVYFFLITESQEPHSKFKSFFIMQGHEPHFVV